MPRVLMVTRENRADRLYGIGKSLEPVVAELQARGLHVRYVTQEEVGGRSIPFLRKLHGIASALLAPLCSTTEVRSLLWALLERLNMGRYAARIAIAGAYTHVHCHDPFIAVGLRWFLGIRRWSSLRRLPKPEWGVVEHGYGSYAQTIHEDGARLGSRSMRWLRRWEARTLSKAGWVVAPTHAALRQLARDLARYPVPATWCSIPHPLPRLQRRPQAQARERLGWSPGRIYVIAAGRLVWQKGFDILLTAFARIDVSHARLVVLGHGDGGDIAKRARELGLSGRVQVTSTEDIGLYYSAADLYVSASRTESFGLAVLEALSMGLPTVCTAVGGVPEVVGSGARLVPPEAPALADALRELICDQGERARWSQRALARARSWPAVTDVASAYAALPAGPPELTGSPSAGAEQGAASLDFWQRSMDGWRACPLPGELPLADDLKVLVLAPHPDDETLGCGGTLARLRSRGATIRVAIVTDGAGAQLDGVEHSEVVRTRRAEATEALAELGIDDVVFFDEPDGACRSNRALTESLRGLLTTFDPEWLFLPSPLDYHRDHVTVALAALDVWQQLGCQSRAFFYEIWQPLPATAVTNVSAVFQRKLQALGRYATPLKHCDYIRAAEGLAAYRSLARGRDWSHAEAFMEVRRESWLPIVSALMSVRAHQETEI